jgi:hypothetical protein
LTAPRRLGTIDGEREGSGDDTSEDQPGLIGGRADQCRQDPKPMKSHGSDVRDAIVGKAKEVGASLAGIAALEDLKASPSNEIYDKAPYYDEYAGVKYHDGHKSILVWALDHPSSEPVLDWFSLKVPGLTPGNRALRRISKELRVWMGEELGDLFSSGYYT